MATNELLRSKSYEASGDLSSSQYLIVKLDSNGQMAVAGAGEVAVGVLQDDPAAQGRAGACGVSGTTKCVAGAAIAAGALVAADASGKAITATTGAFVVGVCEESAGGADEIFELSLGATHLAA